MNLHNLAQLNPAEQKELIKKLTPYVAGATQTEVKKIKVGKHIITGNYSQPSNSFTASIVETPQTPKHQPTKLDELINSGTIVKKGNWYTYNGKNYLGVKKINEAIKAN